MGVDSDRSSEKNRINDHVTSCFCCCSCCCGLLTNELRPAHRFVGECGRTVVVGHARDRQSSYIQDDDDRKVISVWDNDRSPGPACLGLASDGPTIYWRFHMRYYMAQTHENPFSKVVSRRKSL